MQLFEDSFRQDSWYGEKPLSLQMVGYEARLKQLKTELMKAPSTEVVPIARPTRSVSIPQHQQWVHRHAGNREPVSEVRPYRKRVNVRSS